MSNIHWWQTSGLEEYECSDEYMEEVNKFINELKDKEDGKYQPNGFQQIPQNRRHP